jgi:hypothetical protein
MTRKLPALSLVLGAVIALVAVLLMRDPSVTPAPERLLPSEPTELPGVAAGEASDKSVTRQNPFASGEAMELSQAEQETGFRPPQPHHPQANESLMTNVFVEVIADEKGSRISTNAVNHLAMTYSSGVMIVVAKFSTLTADKDPKEYYELLSGELDGEARVETIKGQPAMIIAPTQAHLGSVDLVWEGLRVTVYGHVSEFSEEDLKDIASSLSED